VLVEIFNLSAFAAFPSLITGNKSIGTIIDNKYF
jgi:hypothetical protein